MKTLEARVFDNTIISREPYWIDLFPQFNVYRFLGIDDYDFHGTRSKSKLFYKPIILVNGYRSSYLTWNYLAQRLWLYGFRNIFALNLQNFTKTKEEFLDLFDNIITTILTVVHSYSSVVIIGHSIGGVLTRYYAKLNEIHNIKRISLLMTIASPYYEIMTYLRDFGFFFDRVFPPDMINLFKGDNGLYSLSTVYQPLECNEIPMVNVDGDGLLGGDGLFWPQNPCEMVNVTIHKNHFRIIKCPEISNLLQELLCNKVIIYKISLTEISFPIGSIGQKLNFYFEIRDGSDVQRYPAIKNIKVTPNGIKKIKPTIIYTGKTSITTKEKELSISMFKKNTFTNEKLIEGKIEFNIAIRDPLYLSKNFRNKNISFSVKIFF